MGKNSKKELQAKLTEADSALHHLESTRAALSVELRSEREELRAERERHAEETAALRREHEQALDEIRRSTQEEMARAGEHLAEARAALEKATEGNSRLTADLRDRDDRAHTLLQELEGGVEAALGQLSGALTRIRDAAVVPATLAPEAQEPDAPEEDAEPADLAAAEDDGPPPPRTMGTDPSTTHLAPEALPARSR